MIKFFNNNILPPTNKMCKLAGLDVIKENELQMCSHCDIYIATEEEGGKPVCSLCKHKDTELEVIPTKQYKDLK